MRIRLVTPLCMSDFVTPEGSLRAAHPEMAPQLGILCLAASLIDAGFQPELVNLDQKFMDYLSSHAGDPAPNRQQASSSDQTSIDEHRLFDALLPDVVDAECDVVGFGTISSTFPLTIRLARVLKATFPRTTVILGGPQASVVDTATVQAFPEIDYVLRGEADHALPRLLSVLDGRDTKTDPEQIDGVTFTRGGRLFRNPNAPRVENLDSLPLPAFHLDPEMQKRTGVHLEVGRGCPFACTFCSTNDFFRRSFRLKSDDVMIDHMSRIQDRWGIRNFSLVHDMYTIDRKRVLSFCAAIKESGRDFVWSCSARTDRVDAELLSTMADAGCQGIFFGIETGSERLQKSIKKNLNLAESRQHIAAACRCGMGTAVALITAFPDETRDDLRATAEFFVDSLRFDHAEPQISLLAPLAETPLATQYRDGLVLDQIYSDMSHQGWRQDPEDLRLIQQYPELFSNFYSIPTKHLPRRYFSEVRNFLLALQVWVRWVPVTLLLDSGDLLRVHDLWCNWRSDFCGEREPATDCAAPYYCTSEFVEDFARFIRSYYIPEISRFPHAVSAVTHVEMDAPLMESLTADESPVSMNAVFQSPDAYYPHVPRSDSVLRLEVDYKQLVECLRQRADLAEVTKTPSTVAVIKLDHSLLNVRQLNGVGATLIDLCDGSRTVDEMIPALADSAACRHVSKVRETVLLGLSLFHSWKMLSFSPQPVNGSLVPSPAL